MKKLFKTCSISLFFFNFSVLLSFAQPVISSFSPTSGSVGTTVTITGSNFNTTAANNIVFFGATMAVVNTATATSLSVTVPVGANYNFISVTNISNNLSAYSSQPFLPTFSCGVTDYTNAFKVAIDTSLPMEYHYCIVACDLNGDGKSDIALANYSANKVSIFKNTSTIANISFASKVDITTGSGPYSIASGDFNGDGKLDLAIVNKAGDSISVLKNTSTIGTISFAAKVDFATNSDPQGIAIGDFDADGKPDIVVANHGAGKASVFRNTSTLATISFSPKVDFTTGALPQGVAIGDFDGDGKLDFVTPDSIPSQISVFRNICTPGTISFAAKVNFTVGSFPHSVVVGDIDSDGKVDVATANDGGTISILRNISSVGTILFATKINVAAVSGSTSIAIGDLDGNGKPDLAVTGYHSNVVSLFSNNSVVGSVAFAPARNFFVGNYTGGVAIDDLDGDGKSDVVDGEYYGNFSTLRNNMRGLATMTSANSATICSGSALNLNLTSDSVATYSWVAAANPNVTGASTTPQTTNPLNNVLINTSSSVQTVVYTVNATALLSSCAGSQTVTVAVNPSASINLATGTNSQTVCINTAIAPFTFTIAGGGTGATITGLPPGVTGVYNAGIVTINGTPSVSGIFNYTVSTTGTCTQASTTGTISVDPNAAVNLTSAINSNAQTLCIYSPITDITYSVSGGGTGAVITGLPSGVTGIYNLGTITISGTPNTAGTFNFNIATTGVCIQANTTGIISVNPLPLVSSSGLSSTYCNNASAQTLTGSPAGGIFSGTGVSGNNFNPIAAGSGTQTITYTYTNSNSCLNTSTQSTTVLAQPSAPTICMVTVDDPSNYNIVYWDKTPYTNADSFIVYREIATNVYKRIAAVSKDSLSQLIDTARYLYFPNTGDPNGGTYRYKLSIRDTCGNESPLSLWHNTIFTTQTGGTFNWNPYLIEAQTPPVLGLYSYFLERDNTGSGSFSIIGSVAGTQTTISDPNYALYPYGKWRISTGWSTSCTPTRVTVNTTRSNIKHQSIALGINSQEGLEATAIYPNPANEYVSIEFMESIQNANIRIMNSIGQIVYEQTFVSSGNSKSIKLIDTGSFAKGIYTIVIESNKAKTFKKLVIN